MESLRKITTPKFGANTSCLSAGWWRKQSSQQQAHSHTSTTIFFFFKEIIKKLQRVVNPINLVRLIGQGENFIFEKISGEEVKYLTSSMIRQAIQKRTK